jgi:tRNA pseudouridine55 synthase
LLEADKTYQATLKLGVTTTTADAEGEMLAVREVSCSEIQVRGACARFLGEIEQVPPMYSALKHQGRALYEYARQGVEIAREARRVTIFSLEILRIALPEVEILVRCSKGTYIRTLAEDIGEALGCGAHLIALRRTGIGPLDIGQALTLETIAELEETARTPLLAQADALVAHLDAVRLDAAQADRILHGQAIRMAGAPGQVRLYGPHFLGLGEFNGTGELRPVRLIVFNAA